MIPRLPALNALRVFEVAARHLSFKRAAEELSVTPTAVSHQIRGLEADLGVVLFRRLTRALELTPEGEVMLPKVREGMECFAAAVRQVRAQEPGNILVVLAPPSFASRWLVPRLQSFSHLAPEVELHLASSTKAIDGGDASGGHGMDRSGRSADDPEIWIRYGSGDYPGFRVERLFAPEYTAVCSTALLRGKIPLRQPTDLRRHNLIHDDTIPEARERPSWEEWLRLAGVTGVNARAGHHFSDSGLAISAALDGLGVALLSRPLVEAEISSGRLVAPFEISIKRRFAYHLVMSDAVAGQPQVELFRTWILKEVHDVGGSH
jgi:LysR family glycine cleavage system transcriptional activator